ncbi:hypothetical protein GCM10010207_71420 [Streptomyces atratus]|nr:hypothetical protein GCM10010207_71420 [Streptomyces atratus]
MINSKASSRFTVLRSLEQSVERRQEARAGRTVTCAVIGGERGCHGRVHSEHPVHGHRTLDDTPQSDERDLRWVDHPEHSLHALVAEVRHRKRGVGGLRGTQAPDAGP